MNISNNIKIIITWNQIIDIKNLKINIIINININKLDFKSIENIK